MPTILCTIKFHQILTLPLNSIHLKSISIDLSNGHIMSTSITIIVLDPHVSQRRKRVAFHDKVLSTAFSVFVEAEIDFSVGVSKFRVSSLPFSHDEAGFDGSVFGPLGVLVAGGVAVGCACEVEFLGSLAAVVPLEGARWF